MAWQHCKTEMVGIVLETKERSSSPAQPQCKQCGAPLAAEQCSRPFCHVCNTMFESVRSSHWLRAAQAQWVEENYALAQKKRALLGIPGNERDQFGS